MKSADLPQDAIRWPVVLAALAAGVAAAMQIGKASAAMPLLRAEFGVSLTAVSSYLATVSLGAALLGLAIGLGGQRFGLLRAGVAGLAILSLASLLAAVTQSWSVFFATRIAEAVGMPLVIASMPAMVQSACGPARRTLGLGIWAMWLPLGIALAMFLSVALGEVSEWRSLYLAAGLVPLLAIGLLLASRPDTPANAANVKVRLSRLPAPLLAMAAVFMLFSAIYLTFAGFLPALATSRLGFDLDDSAIMAGFMALLIVAGNLAATFLLLRGVPARILLALAFACMGISALVFLLDFVPVSQRILAGGIFNLAAGVAPGVIWAQIPVLTQKLGLAASLVSAVFYQASGVGQFAGPILGGLAVEISGNWLACLLVILPGVAIAIWLSLSRRA